MTYLHSVEDCDVVDRERLMAFRERGAVWHELLHGDELHSISSQFSDMMWQDAAWRCANEARRYSAEGGPTAAVTPILGAMLDRGYVSGQVIAIARLLEPSNPTHPKKAVVSLKRLVDDISENRHLFTREIFVAHDGLPYDWEACRAENLPSLADGEAHWMDNFGPNAWASAMGQHENFDALSGTADGPRSREDRISDAIFERLEAALTDPVFKDVLTLRHKVVAHAADAFSRAQASDLRTGLKLDEFARAQYILLGVMQAISSTLLFGGWIGAAVPLSRTDQFENLDKPFVAPARLPDLRAFWGDLCDERDGWLTAAFEEMLPELMRASRR